MTTTPISSDPFFADYSPTEGVYDELFDVNGNARAHAETYTGLIEKIGRQEFSRRWLQARRMVNANGFAYSGHVSAEDQPRPWELDALPLVVSSEEWCGVSAAMSQRARLMNLVLKDLFGPQTLLSDGTLPADLVYAHPGFRRPFHRPNSADQNEGVFLHCYAADLARSSDGRWWVLADRTEAPSGLGYALENRVVISRLLPDVFQHCQVERLAPFFVAAQESLRKLSPRERANPRVVFLNNGPTSPNYFEDAYLARYLGYTLVEGGDLAVRDRHVMLKTLGGLLPVDVIVRRQNSTDCDPLELGSPAGCGVAGLTQAVREGNVRVVNSLGSGLVESTAFMAFVPQLCQRLLGEDLKLPSVASWWCGQPQGLAHVLDNLDSLIVQPAFRNRGYDSTLRDELASMSHDELAKAIRANPIAYAAQERVDRSSVPVWSPHRMDQAGVSSSHLAVRSYCIAVNTEAEGDSESSEIDTAGDYLVFPGALARTSSSNVPLDLSIAKGEGSKDVWVLADGPVDHVTLLDDPGQSITLKRSGDELPSRAADNIFWLGRQLERAESSARILHCLASRLIGETRATSNIEVPVLLRCLAELGQIEPGYALQKERAQLPPIDQVLPKLVFDTAQPASLRGVVDQLTQSGSTVRDRFSLDTWRIIQRIDETFQPPRYGQPTLSDLLAGTEDLITDLAAFSGIIMESMTRTHAFLFLEMGRRIERSLQIACLVRSALLPMPDVAGPVFETMLEVADSLMTYRSRYLANMKLPAVLDLLLTDETNPRSLAFQFVQLSKHVDRLPRDETQPGYTAAQRVATSLLHSVRLLDLHSISDAHRTGDSSAIEAVLDSCDQQLPRLSEVISHHYLVHATSSHQLADISPQQG